jgi:tetratricopeptide (TPR) repeat protein
LRLANVSWGDERLRAAQRTLALFPGFPQAHWLAATVHVARQAFSEAERALRTGLAAVEGQLDGGARFSGVGLHWLLGLLHLRAGKTTQALDGFARELAEEPHGHLYARESCANSWYAIAAVRLRHGDRVAAQEALGETLRRTPHHPLALAALWSLRGQADPPDAAGAGTSIGEDAVDSSSAATTPLTATMEGAFAGAARHVLRDDHPAAAHIVAAALTAAPPGSAGWWLPLEPLLAATARPDVWSRVLTLLRARAM